MNVSLKLVVFRYWDSKWQQDHSYGQENVNDRLGFHHVMMSVGLWPILLSTASEVGMITITIIIIFPFAGLAK